MKPGRYTKPFPIGRPILRDLPRHWLIAELDQLRADKRLTITAFAKKIGWRKSRLQNLLSGKTQKHDLTELEALFNLLGKNLALRQLDRLDYE